jgi:hypothetical protein
MNVNDVVKDTAENAGLHAKEVKCVIDCFFEVLSEQETEDAFRLIAEGIKKARKAVGGKAR